MRLTIKQLMVVHDSMTRAMSFMDEHLAIVRDSGQSWHELNTARAIIRVAIESTGATVEIEETK